MIKKCLFALLALSFCMVLGIVAFFVWGQSYGDQALSRRPLPELPQLKTPPQVTLVLGGGGIRGLAHVGILEELEKGKIPIDMIVACSAGSIVGALYASYADAQQIKSLLLNAEKESFVDYNWLKSRYGLSKGKALKHFLARHLRKLEFEDLEIPLVVVATDLQTGELVSLGKGPLIPAIQASSAYPFVFEPVNLYGRLLVDGGVINPVPVSIARRLGSKIVIAVDISEALSQDIPKSLFGILKRCIDITYFRHSQSCGQGADVLIRPDIVEVGGFDYEQSEEAYIAGKEAGKKAVLQIQSILSSLTGASE